MNKLLGVIMCGGESRRMGTDKGLIALDDTTWVQHAANKLKELRIPVVVSVNSSQQESYGELFAADDLVIDASETRGPLNGILSVHDKYPDADLLLLACDMINMTRATLLELIDAYQLNSGYGFYVYHNGDFFEPLCGIYTSEALRKLTQWVKEEQLINKSLQNILAQGETKILPINDPDSFVNVNRINLM